MNKKILFITYAFPPYDSVGAVRTGKTAKKLIDLGYDVKVVSALNQDYKKNLPLEISLDKVYYADWIDINWPINKLLGIKKSSELKNKINDKSLVSKIIRFFKFLYSWFLHIPDRHIGWYFKAVKKSCNIIDDGFVPNIILSSAPPYTSHLVAKKVSKKYKIPWVAEFRDLWSDNHNRTSGFFDRLFEKNTMQSSNAMVTVSKPLTQLLVNNYKQPIYTIQNGYDEEDFNFELIKLNSPKIKIVYTGFIYRGKNDPSPLFVALSSNKHLQGNVEIDFYGDSMNFISDLSKKYNLESIVKIHDKVSRSEVLIIQKKADILLFLAWNDPKQKGVMTRKLFEYIASGNVILSIGEIKDVASKIVVENNFGIASNNPEEIVEFINSYQVGKYNNNLIIRKKYDRQLQINKLSEIIDRHAT